LTFYKMIRRANVKDLSEEIWWKEKN
jgi:hypothetical protein